MALREIIDVYKELAETTRSPALNDPASGDQRHANYHRLVVIGGCVFAVVGAILGFVVVALALKDGHENIFHAAKAVIILPGGAGIGGFIFGMCVMCLFAPTSFLTGPIGERWMQKIGTTNVLGARVVCLVFALLIPAPFVWIGSAIIQDEIAQAGKPAAPSAHEKAAAPPKADPSPEQAAAEAAQNKALAAAKADLVFSDPLVKVLEQFGDCVALQESAKGGVAELLIRTDIAPYLKTSLMGKSIAENLPAVVRRLTQPDWEDLVYCLVLYSDKYPSISDVSGLLGTEDSKIAPPGLPVGQLPPGRQPGVPAWHQYGRIWFGTRGEKITTIVVDVEKH